MPRDAPILPPDEVLDLFRAVLGNAREFVEEAELLLNAGHTSRAYASGHLAHEELAKCLGLLNIWVEQQRGGAPPWELFWRRWRDHGFKVQMALAGDILRIWVGEQQAAAEPGGVQVQELPANALDSARTVYAAIEAAIPQHADLARLRIDATYVDYRGGKMVLPSEVVSGEMAARMVTAANVNYQFLEQINAIAEGPLKAMIAHPALNEIMAVLRQAASEAEGAHAPGSANRSAG